MEDALPARIYRLKENLFKIIEYNSSIMAVKKYFISLRNAYRDWGLKRCMHLCLMSVIKPWFTLYVVNLRKLNPESVKIELPANRQVKIADKEDLLVIASKPEYEITSTFIENALNRGDLCIAVFQNDAIIAYTWLAFGEIPYSKHLTIKFRTDYRFGYKSFTLKQYRREKLQSVLVVFSDPLCISLGRTYSIGTIETHNFASLESQKYRGGQLVGFAGYFNLFGRTFPFRTRGLVEHEFRFSLNQ